MAIYDQVAEAVAAIRTRTQLQPSGGADSWLWSGRSGR